MFSSSVRRVAFTAPQTPITSSFHLSSIAPRTATQVLSFRQRRYSSSKPSSPADGSSGINEIAAGPGKSKNKADGDKKSKRKGKDTTAANSSTKGREELMRHLPSVPSTQHIPQMKISASDFFSLHRPMSLTHVFPKAVTDEAFAAIFTPRIKSNKPERVISVLSGIQQDFEEMSRHLGGSSIKIAVAQGTDGAWNEETDDVRAAITAESYHRKSLETKNLDGAPLSQHVGENLMDFPPHILTGRYRPFHPPPAPVPMNSSDSLEAGKEAAAQMEQEQEPEPLQRTYTARLTIKESMDKNGDVTYLAHSSPLVEDAPQSRPSKYRFLERMQQRRAQRAENDMQAISVKRQRKLKMKKHKYKKLMRRTRNLRRRLDRN